MQQLDKKALPDFFSGKQRRLDQVRAIPFRWPTKPGVGQEYVQAWYKEARMALAQLKLSLATLEVISGHISRKDGTLILSDKSIASRSGRSLASTERDISRLKKLGFIVVEYTGGNSRRGRVRVLKPSHPRDVRSPQRIPLQNSVVFPSTYGQYVEGQDRGASGNGNV